MKKHLFLTSALVLMLAACAKENQTFQSESDLITVTIGATAQENSKAAIGQKDGEVYPVIWTAGDKIAVNGTESSEAEIQSNPAYAKFDVTVESADSYSLVYPYTEGNGAEEVTFSGTTLPMYAVTGDLEASVSFQALYGVLKFSVTGTETLTGIVLTTQDGSQVTGKFGIGEGGVLTGKDATATTLTVNFASPVALDAETPSEFFIPVPAGTYNIFDVQLLDNNGGSMTRKIGGDNNYTVGAGKVKEFPAFAYEANKHLFAIKSASDLNLFAALVTSEAFADKYEGAKLVGDIIAPEDWTSLDYTGLFEGGNHTISALKAPLFGTLTDATVKNVKLSADMTNSTSELAYGALAKTLKGSTSVVDGCSVAGTILLNLSGNSDTKTYNFAGLVGKTEAGTISNCSSTANVQINHPGTEGKTIQMGAMTGELAAGAKIQKCTVTAGMVKANDSNGNNSVNMFIGGIAGMLNTDATIEACTLPKKTADSGVIVSARMNVNTYRAGGIVGQGNGTIKDCNNAQGVSASKGSQQVNYCYFGGMAGSSANASITGCVNSGTIFFGNASGTTSAKTVQTRIGGIVGTIGTTTVANCTNSGSVEYSGNASQSTWFAAGGIIGYADKVVLDGFVNTGKIVIAPTAPTIGNSASGKGFQIGVGGLVGMIPATTGTAQNQVAGTISCGSNPSYNRGDIRIEKKFAPATTTNNNFAYVGGCIGFYRGSAAATYTLENTGNILVGIPSDGKEGPVTYDTDSVPDVAAGAIIGHTSAGASSKATFDGCKVKCKIVDKKATYTGPAILCGWSGNNKIYKNCLVAGSVNETEITNDNFKSYLFVGGSATDSGNNAIWEESNE